MNELFINKARTIAVTGHRDIYKDFDREKLKNLFLEIVEKGFDTFLVGMAVGFDIVCFQILEEIRKDKDIKIIACIPCLTQPNRFSLEQKKEYYRMLSVADDKKILSEEYTPRCMQKRNEYMVNNAFALVAYLKRDYGGTANTVRYARKKQVPIILFK